jgi:hypothetical protein
MTAAPKLEVVEDRDYLAAMRDVIEAETAAGNYVSAVVAQHIVNKLAVTDPDLLHGWLNANAASFIRMAINHRDSSTRTRARFQARRDFADAARRAAAPPKPTRPASDCPAHPRACPVDAALSRLPFATPALPAPTPHPTPAAALAPASPRPPRRPPMSFRAPPRHPDCPERTPRERVR